MTRIRKAFTAAESVYARKFAPGFAARAVGALGGAVGLAEAAQKFKMGAALLAVIFIDWHKASSMLGVY